MGSVKLNSSMLSQPFTTLGILFMQQLKKREHKGNIAKAWPLARETLTTQTMKLMLYGSITLACPFNVALTVLVIFLTLKAPSQINRRRSISSQTVIQTWQINPIALPSAFIAAMILQETSDVDRAVSKSCPAHSRW
jgi:hypothetical protein